MGLGERVFYRYMSRAEAEAVQRTGFLRSGVPGEVFWTTDHYQSVQEAKSRMSLIHTPEVRLAFRIINEPRLIREGSEVEPEFGEPGGGTEWMSEERVAVEVISVDNLE